MTKVLRIAALAAVVLVTAVAPARADDAQAKALYDKGKILFAEGHYGEACEKLDASFKLNPLSGTRGLLAACFEKIGRLASAWAAYRDSAAIAERQGNADRAQVARAKAAELFPRLAHVKIDAAAAASIPGVEIVIDGVVQPAGALDDEIPVDAGQHLVEARAIDYTPAKTTIDIDDGEHQAVTLAAPVADPTERLSREARLRDHHRAVRRRKVLAVSLAGAGAIATGVAVVFGVKARSQWADAKAAGCTSSGVCPDPATTAIAVAAGNKADVATYLGGAGLLAIAAGAVVYFTRPSDRPPDDTRPRLTPAVTPGAVTLVLEGRF